MLAKPTTKVKLTVPCEAINTLVERATHLLGSEEWSDVGAGLAVLVGRRISEIVLSGFTLKTSWSLEFSQMAKKADDVDITLEIPTLAPAQIVLEAIDRLQRKLSSNVNTTGIPLREAKRTVNRRYSGAIANRCEEVFSDLVPRRSDKDNLYTHIFRAVYATIAAHWYCPPNIPEHQFKAEIQGHFSITQEGKKLPNYSARSNYDDYAIGDGQGNRDGRLGIKLGQVEGLQMIEAFRSEPEPEPDEEPDSIEESDDQEVEAMRIPATYLQAEEQEEQEEQAKNTTDKPDDEPQEAMTEPTQKAALKRPGIYADDLDLMNELMLKRNVTGTPAEVFRALLETFITETSTTQKQHIETVGEVAQTLNWFTDRINRLEQERDQLRQERDRFQAHQGEKHDDGEEVAQLKAQNEQLEEELQQITSLKARNTQLEEELQQTKAQLNGIQQLLGGKPQPVTVESPAPTTSPVMATTSPDQTLDVEKSSTKQRSRAESTDKIADVIDAIIKWNTAQERSEMRLRISFPSVKSLALLMGAGYQPAIKEVMDAKENEIDEIHGRYMIGSRHNRSVQDKDAVLKAIARDYLGLPNWQEAEYTT